MHVIKWFIKNIKQLRKAINAKQNEKIDAEFRLWLEEWRVVHASVIEDEEFMERQKQEYLEQCRTDDELYEKQMEEIQHVERLDRWAERQHPICPRCLKVWCECIVDQDNSEE